MAQLSENPHLTAVAAAFTVLAASLLICWLLAVFLRRVAGRHQALLTRPHGLTDPLEKIPGGHLEALFSACQLPAVPLFIFGAYTALILWKPDYHDPAAVVVLAVGGLAVMVIQSAFFLRTTRGFSLACMTARNQWLTLQALIPLTQRGYRLFHHVPVNEAFIDHLVVGAKGIFTIEVFTPGVIAGRDRAKGATATYDGRALIYGDQTDYEIINQAQLRTEQLSEWLSGFLSEPVAARAIVAMPGWTIKRTSSEGISVVNPKQFGSLFGHIQARPLEASDIQKIAQRLNQETQERPAAEGDSEETPLPDNDRI